MFCKYYQAKISRSDVWYLVSILKSFDHISFDRTIDIENSIFEFFIPEDFDKIFLNLMAYFQKEGIVLNIESMDNRLKFEEV
ncbi:hypothetical protein A3F66_03025 [candidate division TM6 bacterium RIFCSPHIGHO2_12_FULL_32_22]|nr:MAG: hypothetical protein A3F66_03025 [candidate division TM6 bacterium RIFCSPHIGHO2_12_FULL_32_22]